MVQVETGGEIQKIIEVGWRRKWVIILPFISIFLLVSLWALHKPNLYRSTSSIFIEPQKVPSDYVRSTVTTDIEGRLRSISQQMTSRTMLLTVVKKLDLYPEAVSKGVPGEVLVGYMRRNLSVEGSSRPGANFFKVHFVHEDPTKAMLAVSNLVSLFVEESLQIRELQAEDTTEFIEEELEKLKQVLEKQEKAVQLYKRKYMGELPNQLVANLRMLDNLQLQISSNQESQRELDGRRMLIEQEISRLEGELDVANAITDDGGTPPVTSTTLNQLIKQRDDLYTRIANMESMYTSRHPDLVAARRELTRIEEKLRSAREELARSQPSTTKPVAVTQSPAYSLELNNLRRQLTDIKPRLSSLKLEEADLRRQISQYQKRVESSPLREQQLTQLTRDYENTKKSYEGLLSKKMEAQMSENLEKRQQGEKFQILDPANFPERPYLPNRPKLMGAGFVGGMGIGIGLALLLEALFPAFYSLKQLQQQVASDIPITFGVPQISSRAESRRRRIRGMLVVISTIVALVVGLFLVDRYVIDLVAYFEVVSSNAKGML